MDEVAEGLLIAKLRQIADELPREGTDMVALCGSDRQVLLDAVHGLAQLERERDEVRAQVAALREAIREHRDACQQEINNGPSSVDYDQRLWAALDDSGEATDG